MTQIHLIFPQATAARFVRAFLAHGFARVSCLEVRVWLISSCKLTEYVLVDSTLIITSTGRDGGLRPPAGGGAAGVRFNAKIIWLTFLPLLTCPNATTVMNRCATDDDEGDGDEDKGDKEREEEAPASGAAAVPSRRQGEGKGRRRELLEAVLAVGPPVRGASAAEEGGSKVGREKG